MTSKIAPMPMQDVPPSAAEYPARLVAKNAEKATIGWREWVRLPELGGALVKAKVDTGARTSSLHAFDLAEAERGGESWINFRFHPLQRDTDTVAEGSARLVDRRRVTASNGQSELRYVVETELELDGLHVPIELTLSRRDAMGFRMLLGRLAIRDLFLVDPRRSFRGTESKEVRRRAREERKAAAGAPSDSTTEARSR